MMSLLTWLLKSSPSSFKERSSFVKIFVVNSSSSYSSDGNSINSDAYLSDISNYFKNKQYLLKKSDNEIIDIYEVKE